MCGIIAAVTSSSRDLPLSKLHHRGPDGQGSVVVELDQMTVSLGMTRLAIVDRRTIQTPFRDGSIIIAYNGEVYNHRELRRELSNGESWRTECDVEVITRGWKRWGSKVLDHLNGMFAFVLVDTEQRVVFVARDRAGEKPMYYSVQPDGMYFASEIKALPIILQETVCRDLDLFEFDCLENTPFKDVHTLLPGHAMEVRSLNDYEISQWWQLPECTPKSVNLEEVQETIVDAVRIRTENCEVPLAVLFSGGIDSSIIQAITQSTNLYTVSLTDEEIVRSDAKAVSFNAKNLLEVLPQVAYHLDTPATWTAICQWFLSERMSQDGVVVSISGEGADELFGGYSRYRILWHLDQVRHDPALRNYGPLKRYLIGSDEEILAKLIDRSNGKHFDRALEIVKKYGGEGELVTRAMRIDWHTTMQCLLRMADRMTSAFSMENRAPFLDHRVIELAMKLPKHYRIGGQWPTTEGSTKAVLREVAKRLGVSFEIYNEPSKRGFAVPWGKWFPSEGRRGIWDRTDFARRMRNAWGSTFKIPLQSVDLVERV